MYSLSRYEWTPVNVALCRNSNSNGATHLARLPPEHSRPNPESSSLNGIVRPRPLRSDIHPREFNEDNVFHIDTTPHTYLGDVMVYSVVDWVYPWSNPDRVILSASVTIHPWHSAFGRLHYVPMMYVSYIVLYAEVGPMKLKVGPEGDWWKCPTRSRVGLWFKETRCFWFGVFIACL